MQTEITWLVSFPASVQFSILESRCVILLELSSVLSLSHGNSPLIVLCSQVRAAEPEKPVILLPGAPQKPGKPFDLYFQVSPSCIVCTLCVFFCIHPLITLFSADQQLETTPDAGTERGVLLERARQDWRDMKVPQNFSFLKIFHFFLVFNFYLQLKKF